MLGPSSSDGSNAGTWSTTRRSLLAGLGSAAGAATVSGEALAGVSGTPREAGSLYYVVRTDRYDETDRDTTGRYQVIDGENESTAFQTRGTADPAFQYAFDQVAGDGGTVVASDDAFEFGGPATMGARTHLTGQGGTRLIASQTGRREGIPMGDEPDRLPTGHDLLRASGEDVAVTNVTFDANGTQLDNQAVQADQCEGLLLANNTTLGGFQMALSVTRSTGVAIVGNEVRNPNWYGITTRAAPPGSEKDLTQSSDVLIARNRVSGVKFNNVAPYNASNVTVYGNVVSDGGHSLIACSPSQQVSIVANVCRNLTSFSPDPGGEAGIEIEYKETHLTDDVAGTPRARSYDVTVTGNQVDDCPVGFLSRTVPADESDTAARREKRPYSFTVTGNSVSNASDAGLRVRSGADAVLATNTLRNADTNVDVDEEFTDGIEVGLNATR